MARARIDELKNGGSQNGSLPYNEHQFPLGNANNRTAKQTKKDFTISKARVLYFSICRSLDFFLYIMLLNYIFREMNKS